jgi:putative transposase
MTQLTRSRMRAGEVFILNGLRHTLIRLFGTETWQVEVQTTREIKSFEHGDLLRLYCDGLLVFAEDWRDPRLDSVRKKFNWANVAKDLSAPAQRRLSYIKAVEPFPKTAAAIKEIVLATASRLKDEEAPHPVTVLDWRRTYELSGCDPMSLVERHSAKGRRPVRIHTDTHFAIQAAINDVYLQRNRNSLAHTLDIASALVAEKNKQLVEDGRDQEEQIPEPTLHQLRQQIEQIPAYNRDVRRKGRDEAERIHRSTEGHYAIRGPLSLAEIDHTPIDLMIIDEDTFIPMGRPVVTVAIDAFSRAGLGMYVTFDDASFRSVAHCMKHALMPKIDMKFEGVEIVNPWFAYGTMRQLSVDNGQEFHSQDFDALCYANDIDLVYAERKTGWHKPHIERFFGTMARDFVHTIPGTTFSNIVAKGDYNPKKGAVLPLGLFKALLVKWMCDVYNTTGSTSTGLAPMSAWERHVTPQDIPLLAAPLNMTPFIGYREPSRTASENGIQQNKLQYNSPSLARLRDRYGDKIKVEIRWDSADLGSIWVMHPDEPTPIEVPALDLDYAHGLSLYQHDRIQSYVRDVLRREDSKSTRLQAKLDIARKVQEAMARGGRGGTYKSDGLGLKLDVGRYTHGGDGNPQEFTKAAQSTPSAAPANPKQTITDERRPMAPIPSAVATPNPHSAAAAKPPRKPKVFAAVYDGQILKGNSNDAGS